MGFEDLFKKFVKVKFVRNLRYEPHIIETIKYINPESFDNILVFYKEVDYLKSILLEHLSKENIFECNVENLDKCSFDVKFDCIIVFLCKNSANQNSIYEIINNVAEKRANVFVVDYLLGNKLFNLALRFSDKISYQDIKQQTLSVFEKNYRLTDELNSKKNNISIKKYSV
ncbi:MAG: hypothetical protein ACPLXO_02225 [Desulfurella sp.]|uniref:hypothetical protein n=1 Tax=Desulfurella sp. TaxID=1962857 RepID=UPI003CBB16E4